MSVGRQRDGAAHRACAAVVVLAACGLLGACTSPSSDTDGGTMDDSGTSSTDSGVEGEDGGRAVDGGTDGSATADGGPADAGATDAYAGDAGVAEDAAAADAGGDSGGGACADACEPSSECVTASCVEGTCEETAKEDGTACGEGGMDVCVDGACVPRTGCGDGYREPGPDPMREGCDDGNTSAGDACSPMCTPTVVAVSSVPEGEDRPSGPAPGVGIDGSGRALFVWSALRLSASGTGEPVQSVLARPYSRNGVPLRAEDDPIVLAADVGAEWVAEPTVAGLAGGGWVVAWTHPDSDAGDFGSIAYRVVDASGSATARELANAETRGHQHEPRVAALGDGFAIAWTDEFPALSGDPSQSEIRVRLFTAGPHPCGEEQAVSLTDGDHQQPALASQGGGFLVAWMDGGPVPYDLTDPDATPSIQGVRFDTDGCAIDAEPFRISRPLPSMAEIDAGEPIPDGFEPSAAALESGDYAVAWTERHVDPRGNVHARALWAAGDPLGAGPPVSIAATPDTPERLPSVAPLTADGFVVLYHHGDSGADLLRDADVVAVAGMLAPEEPELRMHLSGAAIEQDAFVVRAADGLWVGWSDDGTASAMGFDDEAFRSYLAYLLPES
ncbi:MAG: hypothetical protein ACOCUS_01285 [Polyangiales bacterium]